MRDFLKNVLATLVALFICGIISFVLFLFVIGFIAGASTDTFTLKENTVLNLKLDGILKDRVPTKNPIYEILQMSETSDIGLDDILQAIRKAKENDNIKGIYIQTGMFSASTASLKEMRDALVDFKESGKFIVAYSDTYTQGCYYLSSIADKVILNPQGNLDFHGISASSTFYKGLLEKVGVEMQIFKVGTYKSAVEPYITNKMSDANKEQVTSFANDIWNGVLKEISDSRHISTEQLNALADTLTMLQDPKMLVESKMVDTLMYQTDVNKYLKTLVGIEQDKKLALAGIDDMTSVPLLKESKSKDQIAVLYAEGSIMSGSPSTTDFTDIYAESLIKEIEKLKENKDVKAVVFRVNSPGGSAYASEQIWKAVSDLKAKKPVVVSMGDYAASGGYYISCNATKIIAQPNTLTGSIGIFGMFPNVEGLTNKLGLTFDNVKTNKYADFGDITRPMREDEKRILQAYIERGYDLFLTRCSDGRGIAKDSLNLIAQGRVWTGNQALKIGLVDGIGGISKAIKEAAVLANLKDFSTRDYPRKVDFFETILNTSKEELTAQAVKEYLGTDYNLIKTMKQINSRDYIQAVIPYNIEVK